MKIINKKFTYLCFFILKLINIAYPKKLNHNSSKKNIIDSEFINNDESKKFQFNYEERGSNVNESVSNTSVSKFIFKY